MHAVLAMIPEFYTHVDGNNFHNSRNTGRSNTYTGVRWKERDRERDRGERQRRERKRHIHIVNEGVREIGGGSRRGKKNALLLNLFCIVTFRFVRFFQVSLPFLESENIKHRETIELNSMCN